MKGSHNYFTIWVLFLLTVVVCLSPLLTIDITSPLRITQDTCINKPPSYVRYLNVGSLEAVCSLFLQGVHDVDCRSVTNGDAPVLLSLAALLTDRVPWRLS